MHRNVHVAALNALEGQTVWITYSVGDDRPAALVSAGRLVNLGTMYAVSWNTGAAFFTLDDSIQINGKYIVVSRREKGEGTQCTKD